MPEVKKPALINREEIIEDWEESEQSKELAKKCGLGRQQWCNTRKTLQFLFSFKIGNSISTT